MNFDSHRSLVFGSQIIALLLVVFSLIGQRAELRSQRPDARQEDAFKDEPWRVRLWDDPFRVLRKLDDPGARKEALKNIVSEQDLARQMVGASPEPLEKTLILMVVLDGRSTPEAEEIRLRSRYAVVSALLTAGYRAVSDWGIWPLLARTDEQANPVAFPLDENMVWEPFQTQQIRAPSRSGAPTTHLAFSDIYVCWIRGDKVLSEQLLDQAVRKKLVSEMRVKSPTRFVIFDLGGSDRLYGLLQKPDLLTLGGERMAPPEDIYFLHATLSNWLLKAALNSERSSRVVRLAQDDFYLIEALWRELKQRLPTLQRRAAGSNETLGQIVLFTESDTTYSQGIALEMQATLSMEATLFIDLPAFVAKLRTQDPISKYLWNQFSASTQEVLTSATSTPEEQKLALVQALDNILKGVLIYETVRFAGVALSPETLALRSQDPKGKDLIRLNRLLLEDAYPLEIAKSQKAPLDGGWKLRIFTYLRGLDGRQDSSSARAATEAAAALGPMEGLLNKRVLSEESSGTSQFDHLRRQAMLLKLNHLKEPVVAVGVLGSDVYDKLIVLQALRPELPQAIFFTTDLDALYLHADNVKVARNLLVASANDLHPEIGDGEDGWNVPPMRDSYQTILFEATQRLVRDRPLEDVTYRTDQEAMLFEIGAGMAVRLKQFPRDAQTPNMGYLTGLFWILIAFALALANGILVLWAVSSRQDTPGDERKPAPLPGWARWLLGVECAFAVLALLGLAGWFLWNRGEPEPVLMMEPLSWTLGVSIWPTIVIRCLAFLVALLLMIKASETVDVKYRVARGRLQDLLGTGARLRSSLSLELSRAAMRLVKVARLQQRWSDFWSQLHRLAPQQREPHSIEKLLETIHDRPYRVLRITAFAIIYLAVSIWLFVEFPTFIPGRGFAVLLVEKVTLALGVGLYVVHLLYCFDLHVGAWMLLRALRTHLAENENIDDYKVLETAGEYTVAVGRTLLYPLTVLIILMLSRISLFDAWSMTPSLWIALGAGATVLTGTSLMIVSEARSMRGEALERARKRKDALELIEQPGTALLPENVQTQIAGLESRMKAFNELEVGAFSHWYQQPIFAALVSLIGVLGTVGFAGPFAELLVR